MQSTEHAVLQNEHRDAVNLLYSNSFGGLFVSALASSGLAFGFETDTVQYLKFTWWLLFITVLCFRLIDAIYWKRKLFETPYDYRKPQRRFTLGVVTTAILWCSFVFIVARHAEVIELAYILIIISAMAGGAATVLSGSKKTAISYCFILLIPPSVYLFSLGEYYYQLLGTLGAVFGLVMFSSARKAADFTRSAIKLKNNNALLLEKTRLEQEEVTRINRELSLAYEEINKVNNSLEEEVEKRTQEIYKLSNLDPLTKLYNRSAFTQALIRLLEKSASDDLTLAVLFVDLDGFKQVNDSLGHQLGDQVLNIVAHRISSAQEEQLVGRWGGDEFVLALLDVDEDKAIESANSLIESIAEKIQIESFSLNIGASVGIALAPTHSQVESELIQYSDIAMYEQKKSGAKTPRVFSEDLFTKLQEREVLQRGLKNAMAMDELFVMYQPVVDAASQEVVSCETLIRWSFKKQQIMPELFIELAEHSGLIVDIGRWVLNRACHDAMLWQRKRHCTVSVNVSVVQLLDDGFIQYLDEVLAASQLPPECLILEITESIFAENRVLVKRLLKAIKERSVGVSIDDFGTGYSSMSHLQTLSFDLVKIDQAFVNDLSGSGEAIIKATQFIAKEFDCRTIAEGVETLEQAKHLNAMGIDYLQGYLFARPMMLDEFLRMIRAD